MSTLYYETFIASTPTPQKNAKWFALSSALHASLIAASLSLSLPQIGGGGGSAGTMELVEFDVLPPASQTKPLSATPTKANLSPTKTNETITKDDVVVSVKKTKQKVAPHNRTIAKRQVIQGTKSMRPVLTKNWDSEVVAPALDTRAIEKDLAQINQNTEEDLRFNTDDLASDFNSIDQESNEKINSVIGNLDQQAEQVEGDTTSLYASAANAQQKEFSQLEQASRASAERAAHAREKYGKGIGSGRGSLEGEGEGEAPAGGPSPSEIRALSDLRQMPGNKKPEYDYADRFAGRQGSVTFYAYISNKGIPVKLLLVKSTGHRTLDFKTLKAFKGWKFYPGQAGWVEMPFRWDLKGGPQEMPTTLRRQISKR